MVLIYAAAYALVAVAALIGFSWTALFASNSSDAGAIVLLSAGIAALGAIGGEGWARVDTHRTTQRGAPEAGDAARQRNGRRFIFWYIVCAFAFTIAVAALFTPSAPSPSTTPRPARGIAPRERVFTRNTPHVRGVLCKISGPANCFASP